ncbi:diguanylate cyclase [Alkalimonas collagenimarina]|uniref:diguanylate cyclase n=1 Tax=Alkalimonas collagenimarina TaxID=400390 RepID=A0ABT9H1L9_9GAMM|nr:diguanylate cyclase [Alkalimonas collagenimarina]MDP4537206.1 diguanylate cyclase [Alkalimonas collagenimarina]
MYVLSWFRHKPILIFGLGLLFSCYSQATESTLTALTDDYQALYRASQQEPEVTQQRITHQLEQVNSPLDKAQLLYLQAQLQTVLVYPHQALQTIEQALQLFSAGQQPWLYHMLQLTKATALDLAGTPADGMPITESAIEWAKHNQHQALYIHGLVVRGILQLSLVNYVAAMQDLLQAYRLAPAEDFMLSKGHIAGYIALVYEYRREDELAIPYFEESVEFHQSQGNIVEVSIAQYGLGKAQINLGNHQQGIDLLNASMQLAAEAGDDQGVAYAQKELASIHIQRQDFEEAKAMLQSALQTFSKADNQYMLLDIHRSLAVIALQQSELDLAEQHITKAFTYGDAEHMPIQHAHIQQLQAEWKAASNHPAEAYRLYRQASQRLSELNNQRSTHLLHQLRAQYELDTNAFENQLLQKELELQQTIINSQTEHQRMLIGWLAGLVIGIALLLFLISYVLLQRKKLQQLANFDGLTQLPNRRHTLGLLKQQLQLSQRHHYPLTVAMLDLDYFKQLNDGFGHAVGDRVLQKFARLCQEHTRSTDVVGRIGGEEFLVILPHTNAEDAKQVLEAIRSHTPQIGTTLELNDYRTTVSIGYTSYTGFDSAETMLVSADQALYHSKAEGRNRLSTAQDFAS